MIKTDFEHEDSHWEFVPPGTGPLAQYTNYTQPVTLVVGDYNIDGYPDILVVMTAEVPVEGKPNEK